MSLRLALKSIKQPQDYTVALLCSESQSRHWLLAILCPTWTNRLMVFPPLCLFSAGHCAYSGAYKGCPKGLASSSKSPGCGRDSTARSAPLSQCTGEGMGSVEHPAGSSCCSYQAYGGPCQEIAHFADEGLEAAALFSITKL